jgi:hypothetical protein
MISGFLCTLFKMILYVYAIYCFRINRSFYCQNHFFTSYQQKETGEITINQSRIKFSKTRTTTNQTCGNVKKEPS